MKGTIQLPCGKYLHPAGELRVFRSDNYLRVSFHHTADKQVYDFFWNDDGSLDGTGTGFDEPQPLDEEDTNG